MPARVRKHVDNQDSGESSKGIDSGDGNYKSQNTYDKRKEKGETTEEDKAYSSGRSRIPWKKIVMRIFLCVGMMLAVYYNSRKGSEIVFASQRETVQDKFHEVPCSKGYEKEISKYSGCVPHACGRLVTDILITPQESVQLLQVARKGLMYGGSAGGASILDLHSGALSHGNSFINIYKKMKLDGARNVFADLDFQMYSNVKNKIHEMIARTFRIDAKKLYLTHPTFFSEMNSRPAKTKHDEYWHVHVDKETYPSFHYTSLLYLADYNKDFTGGRFIFADKQVNVTVEPKIGRLSMFTSGSENPHFVEKVTGGVRYALTVSFTCDKKYAIADPSFSKEK